MKITKYAVHNYQFTLVIFLMAAIVGVVTLFTMPRAEDPQINPPTFPILAVYPGTTPTDIEELVVKPIEKKVAELSDVNKIITDIQDGVAVIRVEFNYGVNVDQKLQTLTRQIDALRPELPTELRTLEVKRFDPSDVNILQIALLSENASYHSLEKSAKDLKTDLEKITSLKNVEYSGSPKQILRVDLRLDKLAYFKIPVNLVISSLQSQLTNIPGGHIQMGSKSFNVKTSSKYKTPEDISNVIISTFGNKIIYLKDVASVSMRDEELTDITRINGHRCVLVNAAQKVGANISETHKLYEPILENFKKHLPDNISMIKAFDQASNVEHRISSLEVDFMIAILLVLLTLIPLGFRASVVGMIAIPLSLSLGLVGLNLFGFSLNQISIVGLVVALGLLVDDSIVVIENIERWLREGNRPIDAAINATTQIGPAVLGCTATLIVAFLPMIFLPGAPGEFVRGLPMSVVCAVFASLIVSLTIVPFLASRILRPLSNPKGNRYLRITKRIISKTYTPLLDRALRYPKSTVLIAAIIFLTSLALFPIIGFKLFPSSEKPMFLININTPLQTSVLENNRVTRMIEDSLKNNQFIAFYTSNVGKGNPRIYYNVDQQKEKSDFSQIFVQLKEEIKPLEKKKIIQQLQQQFLNFPYAQVQVNDFEQGPPIEAPISIRIFGDNLDTLQLLASQIQQLLEQNRHVMYINNLLNQQKTDVVIDINKEKSRELGVLQSNILKTVRLSVNGLPVGSFTQQDGEDYDVVIDEERKSMATLENFKNLYVNSVNGLAIPFREIASLTFEKSPTVIRRYNQNRFANVTAFTRNGELTNTVLKELKPKLDALPMPTGYYYSLAGEAESQKDAFAGNFSTVIILTVFLFIAILILQFKTFKSLLIVLSVIPLGLVGGLTMLFLSGNPMSFIAIVGFIGLAGVEVKNSILLVDFTNQLRREGLPLNEAIEKAGEIRFLPVVLTSLTAIGGMLPIALNPNPQISPLAWVLIGGLISSTVLSRIITPVVYKILPPDIT